MGFLFFFFIKNTESSQMKSDLHFCQNKVNLKPFYASKPSKAEKCLFSLKTTGSDIIALPHYNFNPPKVQTVDRNPIRDLFEFQ